MQLDLYNTHAFPALERQGLGDIIIYIYIFFSIECYWQRINSNLPTLGPFLQGAKFVCLF